MDARLAGPPGTDTVNVRGHQIAFETNHVTTDTTRSAPAAVEWQSRALEQARTIHGRVGIGKGAMGDGRGEVGVWRRRSLGSRPASGVSVFEEGTSIISVPFEVPHLPLESGEIKSFARSIRVRTDHVPWEVRRIIIRWLGLGKGEESEMEDDYIRNRPLLVVGSSSEAS